MFTFRRQVPAARRAEPMELSADVQAFFARLRARAAAGDVELTDLLDELADHIGTAGEPAKTERSLTPVSG